MKQLTTKQIAVTGIFLALAICSQFFKNASVFLTGSIINMLLLLTVYYAGLGCSLLLGVITPLTSFLITGSPLIAAVPLILPGIMLGNAVYCLGFCFLVRLFHKGTGHSPILVITVRLLAVGFASLVKAGVMALCIVKLLIPMFGTNLPEKLVNVAKVQFSVVQLITACIGGGLASVLMVRIKKEALEKSV